MAVNDETSGSMWSSSLFPSRSASREPRSRDTALARTTASPTRSLSHLLCAHLSSHSLCN
eukprot:2452491-Rhodomonas_salina.2